MIDWDAFKKQIQANPKKMLGYVLGIATCFLLIWILVVVQTETSDQKKVVVEQSGRLDSLRISLNQPVADSLERATQQSSSPAESQDSSSPFTNAVPTFLILLAAIGGLWFWIKKGSDRGDQTGLDKDIFMTVGTQEITAGHQISVIRMNNEIWVLGTGGQGINLLHRYSEEEWNGPEVADQDEPDSGGKLFSSILKNKKFKGMAGKNGTDS